MTFLQHLKMKACENCAVRAGNGAGCFRASDERLCVNDRTLAAQRRPDEPRVAVEKRTLGRTREKRWSREFPERTLGFFPRGNYSDSVASRCAVGFED